MNAHPPKPKRSVNIKTANAESKSLLLAAVFVGLMNVPSLYAAEKSWEDVTLITDRGAELSLNRDTEDKATPFPPHGHLVALVRNRCDNFRLIHFGTITRLSRAAGRPGEAGKPGKKDVYGIVFDGRSPRVRPIRSDMLLVAGAIPHQEAWITSCHGIQVPLVAPNPCTETGAFVMEGCHNCRLGMMVNLDCKHKGCEGGASDGQTGEVVDMNALNDAITMEPVIGEQCYEIIDCNASRATVGEIVSIGRSEKFVTTSHGCGARTIPRGSRTPSLDIKPKTILEDATNAALRVELPKLPDALPCFTVKATVEVTLKNGSKKEYTKVVKIDVREGGPKPEEKK